MRQILTLALLSVAVVACTDGNPDRITSPTAVGNLQPPGDGDPTYYSSNVNTTYYGGYPGYDNPDATRSAVFTEEFVWSGSTSFWDIRESFSPNYGPFGAESPSEPGVNQAVRTRADLVAYDRSGQQLYQPDTTLPLSDAPPDAPATMMVQPMMSRSSSGLAPRATGTTNVPQNLPGRNALDGRFVTPAGAARVLAQLRKTATELSHGPDKIDFEIRRGNSRSVMTYSPGYGAVTHSRVEDADGTTADTDYQFSRVPGGFVLTEERTTIHLANAPKPLSIVRKYSEPSLR